MRRPRVDLISPPFSGHLHPLLGIGRRLSDDVDVRVVSTESAAARTRASGLEPYTLMAGRDDAIRAITEPEVPVRGHPLKLHAQFRATLAILGGFRDELRTLYRRDPPDLVIVDSVLPVAGYVALESGIPWWTSLPSPCVLETPDGPPAYLGGLAPRHDRFGRARDAIGRTLVRTFKRVAVRMNRRALDALGLPSAYRADGSEAAYSPECILALALAELEFPRRWPAAVRFTGPVRYTPPATVEAPEFRPGRRHVLVSIGTHLRHEKDRVAAAAMTAARAWPDTEFHFTDGRPDAPGHGRKGNFHRLPYVHYSLVARYDLVVHHAGSGVMYETIAAGVPAIVVPLDFDQFDNAVRLRHAGLAIGLRSLEELPHAIERAFAGATSREARHRFRDLVINHPGEEGVAALVRDRLETNSSTVAAFAR
jgi:UDP:flavonoid glycosyltransferase YjiC (YdhE family)